jgi:site-specific DNA-methyltransferase (cytosine-N4-specific)
MGEGGREVTVHYSDDQVTLHHGDALDVLRTLPDGSVDSCVTSPPYFGLRDYGEPGQYGLEASPAEYVETMRALFAEVRRTLADDGTLWLNLGDSYASTMKGGNGGSGKSTLTTRGRGAANTSERSRFEPRRFKLDVPTKNLLGIPWRVAFALQDDGWVLRNAIIWNKPNAMPESVTDRLSCRYEHLFMFSKSPRYWFDLDPIREPTVYPSDAPQLDWARDSKEADVPGQSMRQHRAGRTHGKAAARNLAPTGTRHLSQDQRGRNPGDVWTISTKPFSEAHFAVMPPDLAERCILAGCKPGGTVLDPFSGSGTTGMVAQRHVRKYVGIDLNRDYLDLSLRTRLQQAALDFKDGGAA